MKLLKKLTYTIIGTLSYIYIIKIIKKNRKFYICDDKCVIIYFNKY